MSNADKTLASSREFVRAYPHDDGEVIQAITVYPLYNFRLPSVVFQQLSKEAVAKTNKVFEPENPERMQLLLSHYINDGLAKLDAEGCVISAEDQNPVSNYTCCVYYHGNCMNLTDDGYTAFNFSHIPPTMSNTKH